MKGLNKSQDDKKKTPSASFIIGSIALVFLIIGYQIALFIHHAAVEKIVANHDHPDTVFVCSEAPGGSNQETHDQVRQSKELGSGSNSSKTAPEPSYVRKNSEHSEKAEAIRDRKSVV